MESIKELYDEKKANTPILAAVIKPPKKIKKKDIIIEPIETRELQYYEFTNVRGISIYNGILLDNKQSVLENTEFYKIISAHDIFTELNPSTLTARGEFSNIEFNEVDFDKLFEVPSSDYNTILKLGSNFGEIYNFPNPFVNHSINSMVKSIISLNGENIKIGCGCNESLIDVSAVLQINKDIYKLYDNFMVIYTNLIKEKIHTDKRYIKKAATSILKNFNAIQIFKILPSESITELYNTMENLISDKVQLALCNTYITKIIEIITIFTDYEAKCTCSTDYAKENDLVIDRDILIKKPKNSTRGRKPNDQKKVKRKIQGTGKYFSSQISFEMYNHHNKKITKIKVFRNGNYQIPGVKMPDMSDLLDSIILLKDYLNSIKSLTIKNATGLIDIPYIISVMRNYTCRLVNTNATIILSKLSEVLCSEKSLPLHKTSFKNYMHFIKQLNVSENTVYKIFRYCNIGFYKISEISLNSERYPGLLVKFLRPIPGKDGKKLTIKVLSSGKINLDGCTSELEVVEIYNWIQYIFIKYWSEIIFDANTVLDEVVSDDSLSSYESIYDEE